MKIDPLVKNTRPRYVGKFCFAPARALAEGDLGLSSREVETLNFILEELPLREIAVRMGISMHTADTFKRRIFEKLGVSTLAGAAALAAVHLSGMTLEVREKAA